MTNQRIKIHCFAFRAVDSTFTVVLTFLTYMNNDMYHNSSIDCGHFHCDQQATERSLGNHTIEHEFVS